MEWNIAVLGSVGSGKTTAIRAISDIDVVDTDVAATDAATLQRKATTTVAMDMGVMELGNGDKLRLHGAPGQDRFDFMWEILLEQARGAVVCVDHSHAERLQSLAAYLDAIAAAKAGQDFPIVIAVTHAEQDTRRSLQPYYDFLRQRRACPCSACTPAVMWCDARSARDVTAVMVVMTALLESFQTLPESALHARFAQWQKRVHTP
ncbi:GTP-binding protein [Lampropedia cohaerens]|uniref:GTP-binding protein n=1 Tax=Lampropedia cohaerens TaxID=1610491 RepID=UPI000699A94A|nr:ATP/GTP-binding protein [Lampropedia cohaerens]